MLVVLLPGRLAHAPVLRTLPPRRLAPGCKAFPGTSQISEVWTGLYLEAIKASVPSDKCCVVSCE